MDAHQFARLVVVSGCLAFQPATAWAQAETGNIAGVVRDTSGAVMPGVTVEAVSPALIERVRSVTTDSQGLYRIVDLRPGSYIVTFTLPGFSTFRRDGIELSTGFTATVNAEHPDEQTSRPAADAHRGCRRRRHELSRCRGGRQRPRFFRGSRPARGRHDL